MRLVHLFFFFLSFLCLLVVCCGSVGSDVLCLSGENQPKLRKRNSVVDSAVARAYLSPAVFLGTLRSVLVQRDGTVRAWFAMDTVLKMTDYNGSNRRRRTQTPSRTTDYTRVSYSRNRLIGDFVSLPAVRPRNPSDMYRSTYTRAMLRTTFNQTAPLLKNATTKVEDMEVVYYRSGKCVLEVNQDNLRLGGQYLVFGVKRRQSLVASALPIPNEKRTLRAVKKVLCTGCAKPARIKSLPNVLAVEGSRVQLECHVAGNPIPWVEWYKAGQQIVSRNRMRIKTKRRTSTLVIRRARTHDRGMYECRTGNVVGPASATATLTVKRRSPTTPPPPTDISTSTMSSPWTTEPCPVSHFCNNGGTCIFYKHIGEYVCQCAEGYVGFRCDYKDVRVAVGQVKNSRT